MVYSYTPQVQQVLKLKTKSEPYLHIRLIRTNRYSEIKVREYRMPYNVFKYVIYVWDTREIVDSGILNEWASMFLSNNKLNANRFNKSRTGSDERYSSVYNRIKKALTPCNDNGQPLIGKEFDKDIAPFMANAEELKRSNEQIRQGTYTGKEPRIFVYTAELQKALNSKTKPQPWLHCYLDIEKTGCIYVWDTRQIIENLGKVNVPITGMPANDNHKPLVGPLAHNYDIELATASNPKELELARKCKQVMSKLKDGHPRTYYGLPAGRLSIKNDKLFSSMFGDAEIDNDGKTVYAVAVMQGKTKPSRFIRCSNANDIDSKNCVLLDDQTHRFTARVNIIDILPPKLAIQKYGSLHGWSLK